MKDIPVEPEDDRSPESCAEKFGKVESFLPNFDDDKAQIARGDMVVDADSDELLDGDYKCLPYEPDNCGDDPSVKASSEPTASRPTRERCKPGQCWVATPASVILTAAQVEEPTTVKQAMSVPRASNLRKAMGVEFQFLTEHVTWKLAAQPHGRKIVTSE